MKTVLHREVSAQHPRPPTAQLAAEVRCCFEQGDAGAALRELQSGRQAGQATADHGHPMTFRQRAFARLREALAPGLRRLKQPASGQRRGHGTQNKVAAAHLLLYVLLASSVQAGALEISDSDDRRVALSDFRGRPTLLFYEDRDSTRLNQALKDRLFGEAKARGLLGKVNLVAVAYLKPFDFFPAKQFALQHIRKLESKLGIRIYVDFSGALAEPPLALPTNTSSVVVLDAGGGVVWRHSGRLSEADADDLMRRITHYRK